MCKVNWIPLCTVVFFWQFDGTFGWSSLDRRESSTKQRPSFVNNVDLFDFRETLVASTITACFCWLTLLPLSSSAVELQQLQCPETFASQPLGIQNIVGSRPSSIQTSTTSPSSLPAKPSSPFTSSTSKSKRSASSSTLCTESSSESINGNVNNEYSIHGLIYMPNQQQQTTNLFETTTNDQLIITVSAVDDPSATILAGAKIPMSQIKSFPISFSLSKSNLLLMVPKQEQQQQGIDSSTSAAATSSISSEERLWDQSVLYAPKDLYVSAKICSTTSSSSSSTYCNDATNVKYQGRGYSKLLLLPTGGGGDSSSTSSDSTEDDFKVVRAAASIRLGRSTVPDTLNTW